MIKILKHTLISIITLVVTLNALVYVLISIPYIQNKINVFATNELKVRLHSEVRIKDVEFGFLNKIILKEVYLADRKGNEMLRAKKISVGIDLFQLFQNKLVINTLQLYSFQLNLNKETPKSPLNIQFVLDAFKADTSKTSKGLAEIHINSLIIRRGNISYDVRSIPYQFGKINASHLRVKNFTASISLHKFTEDSVNFQVKKLGFDESSGFVVKKLSFKVKANKRKVDIVDFSLNLPNSEINLKNLYLDYSRVDKSHAFNDYAKFNVDIPKAKLCLHDFSPFVPLFRNYFDMLNLDATIGGTINSLSLKHFNVNSGSNLRFDGRGQIEGVTDLNNAYLFGKISELQFNPEGFAKILKNLSIRYSDMVQIAQRFGKVQFNGEVSGYFSDIVAFGALKSDLGLLRTDLKIGRDTLKNQVTFMGELKTDQFNVGKLVDNKNLGTVAFNLKVNGYQKQKSLPQGKIDGEIAKIDFNNYQYKNIIINGLFEGTRYEGNIEINDLNGYLSISGNADVDPKKNIINIYTRARNIDLSALNLSSKYPNSKFSFVMKTNLSGVLPDNVLGEVRFDSIQFVKNNDRLFVNNFTVSSTKEDARSHLKITSPFINGELKGIYSFSTLPGSIVNLLSQYVPALIHPVKSEQSKNDFDFSFQISDSKKISEIFDFPITFYDGTILKGVYNDFSNHFYLESSIPFVKWKNHLLENVTLVAHNELQKVSLNANCITRNKSNEPITYGVNLMAQNDLAACKLNWNNSSLHKYSGELNLDTRFVPRLKGNTPAMDIAIKQSSFVLNDTMWNVAPAKLFVDSGRVQVKDFSVYKENQFLKLNGNVSKNSSDTLLLSLKNIDLDYVFNIVKIKNVHFGGNASGDFVLNDLLKNPKLLTDNLKISDFAFNGTKFGLLKLHSEWDADKLGILMKGSIDGYMANKSLVNGYIFPTKDSIVMNFDAKKIDLLFLRNYLGGFMKNLTGYADGKVCLAGNFSRLTVTGDAKLQDFRFGIGVLNTYYTVNDSIHLREKEIYFNNVNVLDKDMNVAFATGRISHHFLQNWKYNIQINTPNWLVYNAGSKQNPLFYGPVYASGKVSIHGNELLTNIDVNIQTKLGTKFVVSLNEEMSASEYNFITFRNKKEELKDLQKDDQAELRKKMPHLFIKPQESTSVVNMNLLVDITPASNLNLVMDPVTGDVIETNGSGNMRLVYNTKKDVEMFGAYSIERGIYNFSFQNFIKKRFNIKEGSTVSFNGSPFAADLDIKALYTTNADLKDLDESFATDKELSRTVTQVQCVLNVSGDMHKPDLKFDLNLPNNTEEVNRRVKSIVNTEDMMSRQIIYLLSLNSFYTPDYLNSTSAAKNNQLSAIASATLSSQLNNVMSQLTDKVNMSTNLKLDNTNYNNIDMQVALSSQLLNNRLLLNGNLGYRDNVSNKATFIGDFDLEYKLTKSGEIRIKGYNRSNDRYYYLKSSLTTQGLGLIYKKDFDNLLNLFKGKLKDEKKK